MRTYTPSFFSEYQSLLTQSSVECVLVIPAHCLCEAMPPSGPSVHQHMSWNVMCTTVQGKKASYFGQVWAAVKILYLSWVILPCFYGSIRLHLEVHCFGNEFELYAD